MNEEEISRFVVNRIQANNFRQARILGICDDLFLSNGIPRATVMEVIRNMIDDGIIRVSAFDQLIEMND